MSGPLIVVVVLLAFALWGGYLVFRHMQAKSEARDTFVASKADGTLEDHVFENAYGEIYMRTEGPRFGKYLFVTAISASLSILIALRVFNLVWNFVWLRTGKLGWFDVGELPHSLATVFLYVGIMFLATWFAMQRYHKRAPGKLRNEIKKLNGKDGGNGGL
jgi:hypothetical protein